MRRWPPRSLESRNRPELWFWRFLALLALSLGVLMADPSLAGPNLLSSQPSRRSIEGRSRGKSQLVALPFPGGGIPAPRAASTTKGKTVAPSSPSVPDDPFSVTLEAEHNGGFYEDAEPSSVLGVSLNYLSKGGVKFTAGQSVTKLYLKTPGESEWQASDTALSMSGTFTKNWFSGITVGGNLGATLPVSEVSQRVDEMTRLSGGLKFGRKWWSDKLSLSLAPSARYHVNRFTTTPTYEGSGGGRPLTQGSVKGKATLGFQLTEQWSASAYGSIQQVFYEKVKLENSTSTLGVTNPPTHFYDWGASLDFELSKMWSFSLGYTHSQKLENPWGVEVLVFDDRVSQWSAGAALNF